jgi:hypothetical protein
VSSLPGNRTQYTLYAILNYAGYKLDVDETIRYTNSTGETLYNLVLAVEPNRWKNCFHLNSLSLDGNTLSAYTLDDQRLEITLPQPLAPGGMANLTLAYDMLLPSKSRASVFGYTEYQINLSDWYPFIVPYVPGQGWLLHDAWTFGEHLVYDAADFDVYLRVDADFTPVIAASAPTQPSGEWTHSHLDGARTFTLSVSDRYKVVESAVGPAAIRSIFLPGHEDAGDKILWTAIQAVGLYGVKFATYPYTSLSIVETDIPDGQEYDGMIFLSRAYYTDYNGSSRSNLVTIAAHEIAHQWWFGLVGNDQALEPWLDEALATYSEHVFYEYNYPNFLNWWWNFRVNYFDPAGWVDTSIYNGGSFRPYTSAVYLHGAEFLEDLRNRIGDEAFYAFIQDYAAQMANRRATGEDFFRILRQHTDKDFSDILSAYFQSPH